MKTLNERYFGQRAKIIMESSANFNGIETFWKENLNFFIKDYFYLFQQSLFCYKKVYESLNFSVLTSVKEQQKIVKIYYQVKEKEEIKKKLNQRLNALRKIRISFNYYN